MGQRSVECAGSTPLCRAGRNRQTLPKTRSLHPRHRIENDINRGMAFLLSSQTWHQPRGRPIACST